MKRFFLNMVLVFSSLIVFLVCIELVTQLYINVPSPYSMRHGTIVQVSQGNWAMKSSHVHVMNNNVDVFNKQLPIEANSSWHISHGTNINQNKPKTYLIGYSQTFEWGILDDDTWANHLQCEPIKNEKNQFKVISLGVPSIQLEQYEERGFYQLAPPINLGDTVIIWNT